MKRIRHPSSSEDSDNGSSSTSWSQNSKAQSRRSKGKKPSEVFRTDLITAMKVHDSYQLNPEDYYVLADPWRQEWEKGVQVPVSPQSVPQPVARVLAEKEKEVMFIKPKKLIRTSGAEALGYVDIRTLAEGVCRYDLNEDDVIWLNIVNEEFADMGMPPLDELTMERIMEEFERCCHDNMSHAMETEEGLGIEYDEDVVCDVCQSPDGEDNNEMVFCDKCNICVHQACYGIQKVPKGSWLCRICALGILPKCQLCPKKGGAMKPTRSGTKWIHVSCALWIPEVSIGNPEKMEPITNVSHIPSNRWALVCCVCQEKTGACIQCSAKNCRTAFHVTCGLQAGLEMNTILTEEDEVKFKSYCPKHSGLEGDEGRDRESGDEEEGLRDKKGKRRGRVRGREDGGSATPVNPPPAPRVPSQPESISSRQKEEKRVNLRKLKLQEMEEDFYQFVEVQEVSQSLKLSQDLVDFVFQYWKLKRKANFNQPLLTPRKDEEESLARREQEVLLRRLQLFMHLRQDLERVRNLTYMVTRREKLKRVLWRLQEQIFQQQVRLLDQELVTGDPSAEHMQDIFSAGRLSSQNRPVWGQPGLKSKRSKQDRRGSGHRRGGSASPNAMDPKEEAPKPPEGREGTGPAEPTQGEEPGRVLVQSSEEELGFRPSRLSEPSASEQGNPGTTNTKQDSKRAPRMDAGVGPVPVPEQQDDREEAAPVRRKRDSDHEQEERKRKRRKSALREGSPGETKSAQGSRPIVKTVSVRLRDIRHADAHQYPLDPSQVHLPTPLEASAPPKPSGWVRRPQGGPVNGTLSPTTGHPLRNWGKFRIPKKSERPPQGPPQEQAEGQQNRKPLLRPLTNTPAPSYPRTRLRTGTENAGYAGGDAKPSDGEVDACMKRCHSHQLRGDAGLGRRYGSDIIRRGVLAS